MLKATDISDNPMIVQYLSMIRAVSITCNPEHVFLIPCADNNPYYFAPELPGFETQNWRQIVEKEVLYNVCMNTQTDGSEIADHTSRSPACMGNHFF